MAKARMKCLTNRLSKLTVGPGGVDSPTYDVKRMFSTIQKDSTRGLAPLGHLSVLKELDLDLSQWEDRERGAIIESIRRCGEICGASLEVWRGTLPGCILWDAEELGDLFSMFDMLKVIHLPKESVVHSRETEVEEYVTVLAKKCGTLKEVRLDWGGKVDQYWMIIRGEGSRFVVRQI